MGKKRAGCEQQLALTFAVIVLQCKKLRDSGGSNKREIMIRDG
jgi:hypothetical protein